MSRFEEVGSNVRDWAGCGKDGRTQWCCGSVSTGNAQREERKTYLNRIKVENICPREVVSRR